jgi:hypothetical protein
MRRERLKRRRRKAGERIEEAERGRGSPGFMDEGEAAGRKFLSR